MARKTNQKNLSPVIDAARRWVERCLISDGSVFTNQPLWTPAQVFTLESTLRARIREGEGGFWERLVVQMAGISPSAHKLLAEVAWGLLLFTVTPQPEGKRKRIKEIWDRSGEAFPLAADEVTDPVLLGIGNPGAGFSTNLWRELLYFLTLVHRIKRLPSEKRVQVFSDFDAFFDFIRDVPMEGKRQYRHMLRYFAFPERVERMASNGDRRAIIEAFKRADRRTLAEWDDRALDEALFELRRELEAKHPGQILDFYEPPLRELWKEQKAVTGIEEVLRRYHEEKIIFNSSSQGARYAVGTIENGSVSIVRLDAQEPQVITLQRLEDLVGKIVTAGQLNFTQLDNTSAIRNTVLQAPEIVLSGDKSTVIHAPDREKRLVALLDVLQNLKTQTSYKQIMLLCVLDGIDTGELAQNAITFHWIASRFIEEAKRRGIDVTETNAAQPFYHLTNDLLWFHAVQDLSDPMRDGGDGANAARTRVRYAFLKDPYWELLQEKAARDAARKTLERAIPPELVTSTMNAKPRDLLLAALRSFESANYTVSPHLVARFICAAATKPFVILTGLAGSGKTKLAQAFSHWITKPNGYFDPFQVGAEIASEMTTYKVSDSDRISVEFINPEGTKVTLARQLIQDWADYIRKHNLPRSTPARMIRESVKQLSEYSDQLHSFETHLKAAAFALLTSESSAGTLGHAVVAVGADWSGNENVLGYPDGLNPDTYVAKPALDLILAALNNPHIPHFLVLDEMNLSHVERYFADLLSALESGEPIHLHPGGSRQASSRVVPSSLTLPSNLFIIGTVNVDETTYMFSPKVLDRANVIEFRVDENALGDFLKKPVSINLDGLSGHGAEYGGLLLELKDSPGEPLPHSMREAFDGEMRIFFRVLHSHGAEFGFRVAHEAARFLNLWRLFQNANGEGVVVREGLDCIILQKLLPKLHGSRAKLAPLLKKLWYLCTEGPEQRGVDPVSSAEEAARSTDPKREPSIGKAAEAYYPLSADKIARMWRVLNDNGFASFAEA